MAIPVEAVPSAFRPGYEKALAVDPVRADAYIRNTMVADPIADAAAAALAELDPRESFRIIEAGLNHREEELKSAPREFRDLLEYVLSPPAHVRFQPEVGLQAARAFFGTADMFIAAIVAKGLVENITTLMAQSFIATGYTPLQGVQRLRSSLTQVLESMMPGGLEWYGDGWKLTVRARLAHAQGRRIIAQQPELWNEEEYGTPVSMAHVAFAAASFSCGVLWALSKMGFQPSREKREGYVHNWRYIAWLIGVPDEILLKDEEDGNALIEIARICEPAPSLDSIIMSHALVTSSAIIIAGREDKKKLDNQTNDIYRIVRMLIGNELADQLDFPKMRTFGLMTALRWKRRFERLTGRRSTQALNLIGLLEATGSVLGEYELHERQFKRQFS